MTEDEARKQLKLAMELSEAAKRCAEESEHFAAQSLELHREVEAFYQSRDGGGEAERRPTSLEVSDRRETPTFGRLAAAVAEQQDMVEVGEIQRRRPITDSGVMVIRIPEVEIKPRFWTRIASWWAQRSPERRLPVGW